MGNDQWEEMEALGRDNARDLDELQEVLKMLNYQCTSDADHALADRHVKTPDEPPQTIEDTKSLAPVARSITNNLGLRVSESAPVPCSPPPPLYILGARAIRPVISEDSNETPITLWGSLCSSSSQNWKKSPAPENLQRPTVEFKKNTVQSTDNPATEIPPNIAESKAADSRLRKYKRKIYTKVEREQRKSKVKRCSCCVFQIKRKRSSIVSHELQQSSKINCTKRNSVSGISSSISKNGAVNTARECSRSRLEFSENYRKRRISRVTKPKKCDCCSISTSDINQSRNACTGYKSCKSSETKKCIQMSNKHGDDKNEKTGEHLKLMVVDYLPSRRRVGRPRKKRIAGTANATTTSETKQRVSSNICQLASRRTQSNSLETDVIQNEDYTVTKERKEISELSTAQTLSNANRSNKSGVSTEDCIGSTEHDQGRTEACNVFLKRKRGRPRKVQKTEAVDAQIRTKLDTTQEMLNASRRNDCYATGATSNSVVNLKHASSFRKYHSKSQTTLKKPSSDTDRETEAPQGCPFGENSPKRKRRARNMEVPAIEKKQREGLPELEDGEVYNCFQCGLHLKSLHLLGLHLEGHRKPEAQKVEEPPLVCGICSMRFYSILVLNHHTSNFHGKHKYRCDTCFASFKMSEILEQHMMTHNRVTDEESIVQQIDCLRSVSPTTGEFSCSICKVSFDNQSALTNHLSTNHVNILDYKCKVCHKPFHNRLALREHTLILHSSHIKGP